MFRFTNAQRNFLAAAVVFCLVTGMYYGAYLLPHPLSQPYSSGHDLVQLTDSPADSPGSPTESAAALTMHSDSYCEPLPVPPETVVIVKTGANEIYDKLPTQLLTSLRCYDDILFFSDLEQNLGPYTIHDALSSVTESVKSDNPEFDYYRMVQEYYRNGQDIDALREETGEAAWDLDKYKFLHMLEKTWNLRPNRKWYVYIEADTYLVQSNLRLWLERLDSSKPLYLGSPSYLNDESFSHGGSGFILSGAALSQFANGDQGVANRYDEDMQHERYGDYMLMKALRDKGITLTAVWPMLQGEKPSSIPFGPGPDNGVRHWCQPVITMHHITPTEANQIWTLEQQRHNKKSPLLFKDLYEGLVAPELQEERDDWDNLSDDLIFRAPGVYLDDRQKDEEDMTPTEKEAYLSFEHCRIACEEHDRCLQYLYSDQACGLSFSYRFGEKRLPDEDERSYKSGWLLAKMERDQNAHSCKHPTWLG